MTERFNIRILAQKVIDLEARLAKLEEPRYEQTHREEVPITGLFTVESSGPKWYCVSPEGVKVNERGLSKDEAQALADDMNGVTSSKRAA